MLLILVEMLSKEYRISQELALVYLVRSVKNYSNSELQKDALKHNRIIFRCQIVHRQLQRLRISPSTSSIRKDPLFVRLSNWR